MLNLPSNVWRAKDCFLWSKYGGPHLRSLRAANLAILTRAAHFTFQTWHQCYRDLSRAAAHSGNRYIFIRSSPSLVTAATVKSAFAASIAGNRCLH